MSALCDHRFDVHGQFCVRCGMAKGEVNTTDLDPDRDAHQWAHELAAAMDDLLAVLDAAPPEPGSPEDGLRNGIRAALDAWRRAKANRNDHGA